MKEEKPLPLFLLSAAMELGWIYAWATYLSLSFLHRFFPFPETLGMFLLASALTVLPQGRGWRIMTIVGIHLCGFVLAGLRMVYRFVEPSYPFANPAWLVQFLNKSRSPLEWVVLFFVTFWCLFLWVRGVGLVRKPYSYRTLTQRFDLGVAAFFLLFFTKLLVRVKGDFTIKEDVSLFLVFSFLLFGLLGLGMARNRSENRKDFLPSFKGLGMILSFTLMILLVGSGLILFFRPYLNTLAEGAYQGVQMVARPMGWVLVTALRWVFFRGIHRPEEALPPPQGGGPTPSTPAAEPGGWFQLLEKVIGWGLVGLLGMALLAALSLGLYYVFRFLLSRTSRSPRKDALWMFIPATWEWFKSFLLRLRRRASRGRQSPQRAIHFFQSLLAWGRRSRVYRFRSETALEYGRRLKQRFPALGEEIDLIVVEFNREAYGGFPLSHELQVQLRAALRCLQNPRHWPSRLKYWLWGEDHLDVSSPSP